MGAVDKYKSDDFTQPRNCAAAAAAAAKSEHLRRRIHKRRDEKREGHRSRGPLLLLPLPLRVSIGPLEAGHYIVLNEHIDGLAPCVSTVRRGAQIPTDSSTYINCRTSDCQILCGGGRGRSKSNTCLSENNALPPPTAEKSLSFPPHLSNINLIQ